MAMTNADVIRKMSDMQLHRFLEDFRVDWFDTAATFCDLCEPCKMHEVLRTESKGCESCLEFWLQSDAMNIHGLLNPHSRNHMELEGIEP